MPIRPGLNLFFCVQFFHRISLFFIKMRYKCGTCLSLYRIMNIHF